MRTTSKATWVATALTVAAVGLTGCATPAGPSRLNASRPTTAATPEPSTTPTQTTKPLPPGGAAVAGYKPANVVKARKFAEAFALAAMSGCDTGSVEGLQHLMTPALYKAALKNPKGWTVLTVDPPMVMSPGCVTSQTLSAGEVSRGDPSNDMPSIRVAVTVTEGLNVGTTTSPKTLKPVTVSCRYTVDVLPSGTEWLALKVKTSGYNLTTGK